MTNAFLLTRGLIGCLLFSELAWISADPLSAQDSNVHPPQATILQNNGSLAAGYIFITPTGKATSVAGSSVAAGPEIIDNQGRAVWFRPLPAGGLATDFRIQTYQGKSVLTWSEGIGFEVPTPGATTDYIADSSYNIIASVQAGNGLNADQHEFELTSDNTALITIYNSITADLSALGGPVSSPALEGVVQEIDIATGKVLLEWHSYPAVGVAETYAPVPTDPNQPIDYFHINSVAVDTDGNLLVSARHTSTIYKIDRKTGVILWRLGGKKSDFALGAGLPFAYQHDARAVDATTLRIFDNESNGVAVLPASRVLWVTRDETAKTASVSQSIQHPAGVSAAAEGNAQALANGNIFVGWGITGRFSEFTSSGTLLFDAAESAGFSSYRAYRFSWTGMPAGKPTAKVYYNGDGTLTVHAIWNGATQVAHWRILGSTDGASFTQVTSADWNGLDTSVVVKGSYQAVQVVALDSADASLAASDAAVGPFALLPPTITSQPLAANIAPNTSVVFQVSALAGGTVNYQWMQNGIPLSDGTSSAATLVGTQSPILLIKNANSTNAGNYTCSVSNDVGSTTTDPATLTVQATAAPGHLVNISCRSAVGTGDQVQIVGFIIDGQNSDSEPVILRSSGPALTSAGITNPLPHPNMNLFTMANTPAVIASDSGQNKFLAANVGTVSGPSWMNLATADAGLTQTLAPGPYTAIVRGDGSETGVALTEVYDTTSDTAFSASRPHLINVSARASVRTGANILIGGFVIGGTTAKTILIRAWGPSLSQLGVTDVLADPKIALYSLANAGSPIQLSSNQGWSSTPAVLTASSDVGATAWAAGTKDSALLVTLAPGSYTAQVSGAAGDSGVSLLEIDDVP